ncbi:hypothetical protein E4U31_007337, partial [Claviceps sp. LM219 group G6]
MLDDFTLVGPNGTHHCLVLELVGPNVADSSTFPNYSPNRRCKGSISSRPTILGTE